jgi:hypothetical protein
MCQRNAIRTLSSTPDTVQPALPASSKRTIISSLNFAALHPSYAANSAPPLTCAGLFFVRLVLIYLLLPYPDVISINATKDGVFLRHCRRTGQICYDFR